MVELLDIGIIIGADIGEEAVGDAVKLRIGIGGLQNLISIHGVENPLPVGFVLHLFAGRIESHIGDTALGVGVDLKRGVVLIGL